MLYILIRLHLIFVILIHVGFCVLSKNKNPLDFTVVKDSTINQAAKSSDGLPNDVSMNFEVLGKPVHLNLKRNKKVEPNNDVYVIKNSISGIPVLVHQPLTENEVVGEYQDQRNGAIFTISCPMGDNITAAGSDCDATMEGTFRSGKNEYTMQLMDKTAVHRARRSTRKLWNRARNFALAANAFSKIYGIFKTEKARGTTTDFKIGKSIISDRLAEAAGVEPRIIRENVLPGGRMYNLEMLLIIDYEIYERFYKRSNGGTETDKDNDAKLQVKKYFSHIVNGVDMMYQSINDRNFSISVACSGFIIADSPETSLWTTPHARAVPNGRSIVHVSTALDELLQWTLSARNIPENDHIMLFTGYDVYSVRQDNTIDRNTAGFARVGSVCKLDSVSVVEDHGGHQSANSAAHELGHGLGSRHDGSGLNDCDAADQFIMTAHGGFDSDETQSNPWRFSTCSVNYFKTYIRSLANKHCLTDPVDIFDRAQFLEFVSTYPGQEQTPNEQCQELMGLDSYYGWGPELGDFNSICTQMACSTPGTGRSYRIHKAFIGTSCGDKRWCLEGRCVFDNKAPSKNPTCVFGDAQRRFGSNQSCRQYMLASPMRCYDNFFQIRCCDTCEKLDTGISACRYGDKFLGCNSRFCNQPDYAEGCCSTCGIAPHPVIREITTSTSTSTTLSTTTASTTPSTTPSTTTTSTTPSTTTASTTPSTTTTSTTPSTTTSTTPSTTTASTTPSTITTSTTPSTTTASTTPSTTTASTTPSTTTASTTPSTTTASTTPSTTTASTTPSTTTAAPTPSTTTAATTPSTTTASTTPSTTTASTTPSTTTASTTPSTTASTTTTSPTPTKKVTREILTTERTAATTTTTQPTTSSSATATSRPTTRPTRTTTESISSTTSNSPETSTSALTPSGTSGLCLRRQSTFLRIFSCSSLLTLVGRDACDYPVIARSCCEKCPPSGQPACVDSPYCRIVYARDCYNQNKRQQCCRTCKRFNTNIRGCEYGDRIQGGCKRYENTLGMGVLCGPRYQYHCCGFCSTAAAGTQNGANNLIDADKPVERPRNAADIHRNTVDTPRNTVDIPRDTVNTHSNTVNIPSVGTPIRTVRIIGKKVKKIKKPSRGGGRGRGRGKKDKRRGGRIQINYRRRNTGGNRRVKINVGSTRKVHRRGRGRGGRRGVRPRRRRKMFKSFISAVGGK